MSQAVPRRDIARVFTRLMVQHPLEHAAWTRRLAAYVIDHKMTNQVDLLINDIAHELQEQAGLLTVEVVSARQLSTDVRQSIEQLMLNQTSADTVVLHETTDQALLGGFVARTADAEIDGSVRTKLKKLAALA